MIPLDSLGCDDYFSRPRSGPCHPQDQLELWWLHRQKNRRYRAARGKAAIPQSRTTHLSRVCRRASLTITRGRWTLSLTDLEIFRREAAVCTTCGICSDVAIKLKAQSSARQKRRCGRVGVMGVTARHGRFKVRLKRALAGRFTYIRALDVSSAI